MDLIVFDDEHDDDNCDVELGGGLIRRNKPINNDIKEDKLYVAVGKNIKLNESLLLWVIQNSGACFISILHVHQPDQFIPICNFFSLPFLIVFPCVLLGKLAYI